MRVVLGAAGVGLMGFGGWVLLFGEDAQDPWAVARWLAGALIAHDAVVAPLTLAVGLAVARLPGRRVVRGTLLVAASLTAVAYPVLFRPGPVQNPSVLPLDYPRDWAIAVGTTVLVGTAIGCLGRWWRRGAAMPRARSRPRRGPR